MKYETTGQMNFFSEMSEHQISGREFFGNVLLDSLDRNFGLNNILISYFDTQGKLLSWIHQNGILPDSDSHPYRAFAPQDVIRRQIYQDAVRENLTYFSVLPRLYRSTDLIRPEDYDASPYARFLEDQFHAHYSVSMAFGINAYIQVTFLKNREDGDFTEEEMEDLKEIYVYVANSYKNFKKYEQAKIISNIQSEIISSGAKAYLVTDDFMHIMSYNQTAQEYLKDILGPAATEQLSNTSPCSWLPFLLGGTEDSTPSESAQTRIIKNYIFRIYTYDQSYSNGIIDRYHWITISKKSEEKKSGGRAARLPLTQTEQKVAELMYQGLTYRAIADELVVSYHTVKNHVQNIYSKCGIKSRYELYQWLEK